ncbi:putative PFL domain-containing protein [Seiridium cardinale]|uniref:PFL domain-containing protein n=1 Tax=Seiridium cardinale TaxID=138064 RepID=A0ABR2XFM3_9PEZI
MIPPAPKAGGLLSQISFSSSQTDITILPVMGNVLCKLQSGYLSGFCTQKRIQPHHHASEDLRNLTPDGHSIPPYFWGKDRRRRSSKPPIHRGYVDARFLAGDGTEKDVANLERQGLEIIQQLFSLVDVANDSGTETGVEHDDIAKTATPPYFKGLGIVELRLSDELLAWKLDQHKQGRVLPGKGKGLRRTYDEVIKLLGAEHWPAPLLTGNVLFGTGWTNMLIGAYDARTLYSNYCNDLCFFYEHGYDKIFPEFEPVIVKAAEDPAARRTPHGDTRRNVAQLGLEYIRGKVDLEAKNISRLGRKTAKLNRDAAHIVCFCEASLAGMAAEAMSRGFDPGACYEDMVASSPGTDVVDIGSDINNSEIMNSFLNTADVTDTGLVSEEVLRRVYDAYAALMARCLTERWMEPLINMNSLLYIWHILNDRHHFLRRIVLGYSKVRKLGEKIDQREGDFDEVFDEHYHTTGFSRPLKNPCDGSDTCSDVVRFVAEAAGKKKKKQVLLTKLWTDLVEEPLSYARGGIIDPDREERMVKSLSLTLAKCYHYGWILEQQWILAHACQHAWQVNYLMEAAMFGSLLDDESLIGKLDRAS